MKILVAGRQAGKTTRLIEMLKNDPYAFMVVFSYSEKSRLSLLYPELREQIVTAGTDLRGRQVSKVYIDNLEMVLAQQFGITPSLVTADVEVIGLERETWEEAADIAINVFNRITEEVESVHVENAERLAVDVAKDVVSKFLWPTEL